MLTSDHLWYWCCPSRWCLSRQIPPKAYTCDLLVLADMGKPQSDLHQRQSTNQELPILLGEDKGTGFRWHDV